MNLEELMQTHPLACQRELVRIAIVAEDAAFAEFTRVNQANVVLVDAGPGQLKRTEYRNDGAAGILRAHENWQRAKKARQEAEAELVSRDLEFNQGLRQAARAS